MLSLHHVDLAIDELDLVTDLTLDAPPGTVVSVIGPNGSGKSTLLTAVAGLRAVTGGAITIDGIPADESDPHFRRRVAADLGDDAVFAELTVAEHLALMARTRDVDPAVGTDLLAESGAAALSDRFPHTLSTGQRARVDLCSVFLAGTPLIVLDEPESGLDVDGRRWLTTRIDTAARAGSVVVVATHRPDLVADLGPTVVDLAGPAATTAPTR